MKKESKILVKNLILVILCLLINQMVFSQQVEVQGELKVTQMTENDAQDNLVIRNTDGTLGTRSASSLPPPPPPIDTMRNLASDFELAKQLCECPDLPPFMIKKLLDSGYSQEELMASGVSVKDVLDAQRVGLLLDTRDNQTYKTLTIGNQTWMAENLNYGNIVDGDVNQSNNAIIEKYCYDDIAANCTIYGGLYQWNEMMQYVTTENTQGICPAGWHLSTDEEWKILEMELGMTQAQADDDGFRGTDQGSQLAGNETLWSDGALDQNGAFGSSAFEAIPGGWHPSPVEYSSLSFSPFFWSSTQSSGSLAWSRDIPANGSRVNRFADAKSIAISVRCVKD